MTKSLEFSVALGILLRGRLGASSRLLELILLFAVTYMVSGNAHVMAAGQQAENMVGTFSLRFDGTDDRVTVPYDASFPTEVFTVSAWIKLAIPSGRAAIIARGEDDNSLNLSWQLYVTRDGDLEIMLEDANENNFCYPLNSCAPMGSCTVTGDLFVADDTWRHVVATRDTSGFLALYIDGEKRAGCDGTGVPSSNNFHDLSIGCTFGTIGPPPGGIEPPIWFFPGLIDEPAMWNVALSEAQVAEVFNVGIDLLLAGLVGFWNFDEKPDSPWRISHQREMMAFLARRPRSTALIRFGKFFLLSREHFLSRPWIPALYLTEPEVSIFNYKTAARSFFREY